MSETMGMYQLFCHVSILDETNTKIIGKGNQFTINVLGQSRGDCEKYIERKYNWIIKHSKFLGNLNEISSQMLDMILIKSCPKYQEEKEREQRKLFKQNLLKNKGSVRPSNYTIED